MARVRVTISSVSNLGAQDQGTGAVNLQEFYAKINGAKTSVKRGLTVNPTDWQRTFNIPMDLLSAAGRFGQQDVVVELWEQDDWPNPDDHIDINPVAGAKNIHFTIEARRGTPRCRVLFTNPVMALRPCGTFRFRGTATDRARIVMTITRLD